MPDSDVDEGKEEGHEEVEQVKQVDVEDVKYATQARTWWLDPVADCPLSRLAPAAPKCLTTAAR